MQYLLCRHIRTNGLQCQSPALRGQLRCFFHDRLHQRHAAFRPAAASLPTPPTGLPAQYLHLAPLEDRESVQVALSVVINALATGQLETKRATALLYGLQLASMNAARLQSSPTPSRVIRSTELSDEGLDLAEPGATGTIYTLEEALEDEQALIDDLTREPADPHANPYADADADSNPYSEEDTEEDEDDFRDILGLPLHPAPRTPKPQTRPQPKPQTSAEPQPSPEILPLLDASAHLPLRQPPIPFTHTPVPCLTPTRSAPQCNPSASSILPKPNRMRILPATSTRSVLYLHQHP